MNPGAHRDRMCIRPALQVGIVRVDQTQDEEGMNQEIQAECRHGKRSKRPGFTERSVRHGHASINSGVRKQDRTRTIDHLFTFFEERCLLTRTHCCYKNACSSFTVRKDRRFGVMIRKRHVPITPQNLPEPDTPLTWR